MHANQFFYVLEGTINSATHATICLARRTKCAFMGGSWVGCLEGLHILWVEQLTTTQNCTISRLSSPLGRNSAIFLVNCGRQICTILEPSRLPDRIRNFQREGWLPSRIEKFLKGATQPTAEPSLVKQPVRGMQQALMERMSFCKKSIKACGLDKTRYANERLVARL